MSPIEILSSQPWVTRLGWTLVHFLWQGAAIALVYGAFRHSLMRASSPRARYWLAGAALTAMTAAPVMTWAALGPTSTVPAAGFRISNSPTSAATSAIPGGIGAGLPAPVRDWESGARPQPFLDWVVLLWLTGEVLFWLRLADGWSVADRMRSLSARPAPGEWQELLRALAARIGLSRPVRLLVSALVQVPAVVGWLRPVVLVPVGALTGLPAEHVEALLLHELAHIRRNDYLVNLLQGVAETLLFYHPAVWWVSGHLRAEREQCCDDMAVQASGDILTYACALAQLESFRPAHPDAALAANGGALADRIARLLGQRRPTPPRGRGPGVCAALVLLAAAGYGLFAQSRAHPVFQTVLIRRSPASGNERFRQAMGGGYQPGGRLLMHNASLLLLIQFAYAPRENPMAGHWMPLLASQVIGGPSWINSTGYDIDATPEHATDEKQTWLMLQALLADRFHLALHRETRELPTYILTAAKGGLKLPPARPAECVAFPPGTKPHQIPGKVDCGYVSGPIPGSQGGGLRLEGRKIHVSDLIRELAAVLDRPVLDRTGFSGEFDLDLGFAPDQALRGLPAPRANANGPNLFAALEEQLGLQLVPAKAPVEVLVVDHAELPAAN